MVHERNARIVEYFNEALSYDPIKRNQFLADKCVGDPSLKNEVNTLVNAYEKDPDFMSDPFFVTLDKIATKYILYTHSCPKSDFSRVF